MSVLFAYGVQVKHLDPESDEVMFFFFCCAHDDCVKVEDGGLSPDSVHLKLGKNRQTHKAALAHLMSAHGIADGEPGTAKAKRQLQEQNWLRGEEQNWLRGEEDAAIGEERRKQLDAALLIIRHLLPSSFVVEPQSRKVLQVAIGHRNARRYVGEIYLSAVDKLRIQFQSASKSALGIPIFWWNADLLSVQGANIKLLVVVHMGRDLVCVNRE